MSVTKTGLSFLSLERDIGISKSLKVTELKPRQSVMEANWIRGTPLNRQKSRRWLFLQPQNEKHVTTGKWLGQLWETLLVLGGTKRRGSRSPSQTSAADGHMSTRFQVERERSLPKRLRIQKSNATCMQVQESLSPTSWKPASGLSHILRGLTQCGDPL